MEMEFVIKTEFVMKNQFVVKTKFVMILFVIKLELVRHFELESKYYIYFFVYPNMICDDFVELPHQLTKNVSMLPCLQLSRWIIQILIDIL